MIKNPQDNQEWFKQKEINFSICVWCARFIDTNKLYYFDTDDITGTMVSYIRQSVAANICDCCGDHSREDKKLVKKTMTIVEENCFKRTDSIETKTVILCEECVSTLEEEKKEKYDFYDSDEKTHREIMGNYLPYFINHYYPHEEIHLFIDFIEEEKN
jgi:hypothetical protein